MRYGFLARGRVKPCRTKQSIAICFGTPSCFDSGCNDRHIVCSRDLIFRLAKTCSGINIPDLAKASNQKVCWHLDTTYCERPQYAHNAPPKQRQSHLTRADKLVQSQQQIPMHNPAAVEIVHCQQHHSGRLACVLEFEFAHMPRSNSC